MNRFHSIAGVWLLALWFSWVSTASAAETVERNPVYRSVNPNWTDLGRSDYPFKTLYVGQIILGGTNLGSGNAVNLMFTNTATLPAGSSAYVTNLGVIAGVWTFQAGIPAGYNGANGANGHDGTNTVTAYVFTNAVLSSAMVVVTNINPLNFTGSNYLGKFSQIYTWNLSTPILGGGGLLPGTNELEAVYFSYTGTNGWFVPTNAPYGSVVYSNVFVSVVGGNSGAGSLRINGIDHPELYGRTNSYFGQFNRFPSPSDPNDAANKIYVDTAVANTLSPFLAWNDTNNVFHVSFSRNNQTIIDITAAGAWIHIDGFVTDGTGTNGLLTIAQTNFVAGWNIQSSTNLALVNGWTTFTNYTTSTNSGGVTFKIPFNFNVQAQFYRAISPGTNSVTVSGAPVTVSGAPITGGGILQLYATTNTPTIADLLNQPGGRLWVSNGTFYVTGSTNGTTTYTKGIAP